MQLLAAVNIGDSVQTGLDEFFAFLPRLIGFLLVLFIGYIIARIVKGVVIKLLDKVGIDRALHSGSTGSYVNQVAPDVRPSRRSARWRSGSSSWARSRSRSRSSASPR